MSVLSNNLIRQLNLVYPLVEKNRIRGMSYGLSYCGYDIRIQHINEEPEEESDSQWVIHPHEFLLASTLEYFTMPIDVVGIVHDKSTWARRGLTVQNTVIEPGWEGYLTLELTNHSLEPIRIHRGDPIAQVLFHRILLPDEQGYSGKYQKQENRPVEAKYDD